MVCALTAIWSTLAALFVYCAGARSALGVPSTAVLYYLHQYTIPAVWISLFATGVGITVCVWNALALTIVLPMEWNELRQSPF